MSILIHPPPLAKFSLCLINGAFCPDAHVLALALIFTYSAIGVIGRLIVKSRQILPELFSGLWGAYRSPNSRAQCGLPLIKLKKPDPPLLSLIFSSFLLADRLPSQQESRDGAGKPFEISKCRDG